MIIFFKFSIFLFLNYLIGKFIFTSIKKKFNFKENLILGISESTFYPIISLIVIGNLTFIINFFMPVKPGYLFLALLIPAIFFIIRVDNRLKLFNFIKQKKFLKIEILFNLTAIFFLSLSTYSISMSHDAGLYHLSNQLWIQNTKINFGLAILHKRFGYSSIYDYINSNFWLLDDLVYLHFVNLLFFYFFFRVLIDLVKNLGNKSLTYGLLIYGILDNFGFNGGKNGFFEIETIGKYDSPFAIIFIISLFLIFTLNKSVKKRNDFEIVLIYIFILFSIQLRPSGFLLVPLVIYVIVYKFGKKELLKILKYPNFIILIISILWFIKNLIISSCLVFPVNFLCIEKFKWSLYGLANKEIDEISDIYNSFDFNESIFQWFVSWQKNSFYNFSTLKNFLIAFLILLILNILFCNYLLKVEEIYLKIIFSILLITYFIFTAPDTRFLIVVYTTIIYFLIDNFKIKEFSTLNSNLLFGFLFLLCLFSLPRFENHKNFIANPTGININFVIEKYIKENNYYYKRSSGYGYIPANGNSCWLKMDCSPVYEPDTKILKIYGYNLFEINN